MEKKKSGQKTFSSFACSLMKTGGYLNGFEEPGASKFS
jgi:hypothetical protein